LIRSKQKGTPIKAQPAQRQTNVINLMEALRRSVEGTGAGGSSRSSSGKKTTPKSRSNRAKGKARKAS
jgi:non-homologous end joining protein Ku